MQPNSTAPHLPSSPHFMDGVPLNPKVHVPVQIRPIVVGPQRIVPPLTCTADDGRAGHTTHTCHTSNGCKTSAVGSFVAEARHASSAKSAYSHAMQGYFCNQRYASSIQFIQVVCRRLPTANLKCVPQLESGSRARFMQTVIGN